ncbi:pectinesterase inhibitor [Phtheirospermum japonicum]|uniref:Pectinesterase inhibitor n=1 Tax=Phtheirospermum japonicum TaxID=374723 RepID=A0A830CJZ3_9LAMI|nr:pectinesterase inhibitor [Phtheirospermum japonicum]
MKLPFASFLTIMLTITLLYLLTITTHAKTNSKLFSQICNKTKHPQVCLIILNDDPRTRKASTVHDLGLGSLDIAISLAKSSADVFNNDSLKMKNGAQKQNCVNCRDMYKKVADQLSGAKSMIRRNDFATTRKILDAASKVPNSCRKELGEPPAKVKRANETLNIIFGIASVILKELTRNKNS